MLHLASLAALIAKDRFLRSLQFYDQLSPRADASGEDLDTAAAAATTVARLSKTALIGAATLQQSLQCVDEVQLSQPVCAAFADGLTRLLESLKADTKQLTEVDEVLDTCGEVEALKVSQSKQLVLNRIISTLEDLERAIRGVADSLQSTAHSATEDISEDGKDHDDMDEGETLLDIAEATGTTVAQLRQYNPSLLTVGENDLVPQGTTLRLPPNEHRRSVPASAEGDSAVVIAAAIAAVDNFVRSDTHNTNRGRSSETPNSSASSAPREPSESTTTCPSAGTETGETLAQIAKKTGTSLNVLVSLNRDVVALFDPLEDVIPAGTPIRIPDVVPRSPSKMLASPQRRSSAAAASQSDSHEECLLDVARATGVTVEELRRANEAVLRSIPTDTEPLPPNTKLAIPSFTSSDEDEEILHSPEPALRRAASSHNHSDGIDRPMDATSNGSSSIASSEARGDTLAEIARLYGTTVQVLKEHNNDLSHVDPDVPLPLGTAVHIPTEIANRYSDAHDGDSITSAIGEVITPTLQDVQTIASIAIRLGVKEDDIRAWNPFLTYVASHHPLTPGIPIRVRNTEVPTNTKLTEISSQCNKNAGSDRSAAIALPSAGATETSTHPNGAVQLPSVELDAANEKHNSTTSDTSSTSTADSTVVTLSAIAQDFGISTAVVRRLNPHIAALRDADEIPPNTALHLPQRRADSLPQTGADGGEASLVSAESSRRPSDHEEVRRAHQSSRHPPSTGDSLETAARTAANALSAPASPTEPSRDFRVEVPTAVASHDSVASALRTDVAARQTMSVQQPLVRPSLVSLAAEAGVTVAQLRTARPSLRQYPENLPLPNSVVDEIRHLSTTVFKSTTPPAEEDNSTSSGEGEDEPLGASGRRFGVPVSTVRNSKPAEIDDDAPLPSDSRVPAPTQRHGTTGEPSLRQQAARHDRPETERKPRQQSRVSSAGGHHNDSSTTHLVTGSRELLSTIAVKYHTTVARIKAANPAFAGCSTTTPLPVGVALLIPEEQCGPVKAPERLGVTQQSGLLAAEAARSTSPASPVGGAESVTDFTANKDYSAQEDTNSLDDTLPREATPRNEMHHVDEHLLLSQDELSHMTSPDHSAMFLNSERKRASGYQRDDEDNDSADALHDAAPSVSPMPMHRDQTSHEARHNETRRATSEDVDSEPTTEIPEPVAMVRAGESETLSQLSQRYRVSETALRAANPQLRNVPHWQPLPSALVLNVPRAATASTQVGAGPPQQPTQHFSQSTATRNTTVPPPPRVRDVSPHQGSQSSRVTHDAHPTRKASSPARTRSPLEKASSDYVGPHRQQPVSHSAPPSIVADGLLTVAAICKKFFVREDTLRQWNPFLVRYHAKTVVPPGTEVFLHDAPEARQVDDTATAVTNPMLPKYVTVHRGERWSLRTICKANNITEHTVRRFNPHMTGVLFDEPLGEGTAVCVSAPVLGRWQSRISDDVITAVRILERKQQQLLMQRYLLSWKTFSTLLGSKAHMAQAVVREERDQLAAAATIARLTESDLRRRVTELRMVVDSLRQSPTRGNSPLRGNSPTARAAADVFAIQNVERASTASAAGASQLLLRQASVSPRRTLSPGRHLTPVVADVRGVAWTTQPERLTSVSPARPQSSLQRQSPSVYQMQLAQSVASADLDVAQTAQRRTVSPKRGQRRSLGLMLNGLRVTAVTGSAEKAGVRPNDAVLRVDGKLISCAQSFKDAVARAPGPRVCITVQHPQGGSTAFMIPLYPSPTDRSRGGSPTPLSSHHRQR